MPRSYKRKTGRASTSLGHGQSSGRGGEGEVHSSGGEADEHMQDAIKMIHGEKKERWKRNKARI